MLLNSSTTGDAAGRQVSQTTFSDGLSQTTSNVYDTAGRTVASVDAAGLVTTMKAGLADPGRPVGVLLFCGPTGVGKSYLACALAQKACRDGYRTRYFYAPKLFRELQAGQADGSMPSLLQKLAKSKRPANHTYHRAAIF
jgi:Mrp family chromosome partitioning ATPase